MKSEISPPINSEFNGSQRGARTLIVGAIFVIIVFHIFPVLGIKKPDIQENRVLASIPKAPGSWSQWAALPSELDAFAIDNFPLRTYLISSLNFLRYKLGYSGTKKVIVGKNGWLFYDSDDHLGVMAGQVALDSVGIRDWLAGFKQRVEFLKRRGIMFYMMMAPVKEDLYPENRPYWMPAQRVHTEVDSIIEATKIAGYSQMVDPRAAMIEQKRVLRLYDEYDTHWTGFGAYLAYQQLMTRVAADFPEMSPLPISDFKPTVVTPETMARDLSLMLGVAGFVQHDRVAYETTPIHDPAKTVFLSARHDWTAPQILYTGSKSGKTLLLIRDSFSSELLPFLKAHFTTIISAHLQDGFFRTDLIERYHPDVVMLEVIETGARFTMGAMPELETK